MRKYVKWGLLLLTLVWCLVIFGFSLSAGEDSASTSDAVVALCNRFLAGLGASLRLTAHFVRKAAHFTEYLILGVLALATLRAWRAPHSLPLALALPFAVALVDETIQFFVPGRNAAFPDVLLDSAGGAFGVLLLFLLFWGVQYSKEKRK